MTFVSASFTDDEYFETKFSFIFSIELSFIFYIQFDFFL